MITTYRVWDGKKMHYGHEEGLRLTIENDGSWSLRVVGSYGCVVSSDEKDAALMWGTGLKDKKGKDIYQKDITEESYIHPMSKENIIDRYVIERKNGFDRMEHVSGKEGFCRHLWLRTDEVEVIGDVFQNPDLLEGAE
ncbi:YopX family protein [Bacillus subtilis]|nr:YopX family protein [Bacillus subtilis]WGD70133.1 YopX family protein [Bacillus subtilis]WGD72751.1 YopX family protein [Bacillus subtilis]WGD89628.1 YopX family protein [Bacillus subtilis]